jgi:PIN domain nuclease of toxin-antitoxin system
VRVLLDTHAFLWWITDDPRLSTSARAVIADAANELFLSAASGWEMAIKARLGRLEVAGDLPRVIPAHMASNAVQSLPVQMGHALSVHGLPDIHRDPFDRILVAQGLAEQMPILTQDENIAKYEVRVIW